MKKFKLKMLF